jgi:hypothetical protein
VTDPVPGQAPAAGYVSQRPSRGDNVRLLFAPPRDADVLISDEIVYYKAPKHVMSLAEPFLETLAVLVVVSVILARPDYDGLNLGLLFLVLSVLVVWRWAKMRSWGWAALGSALVVLYVLATSQLDPLILVPAVGLLFIGRLGVFILRWYRYELRYLTNRRIIEARGLLGLRVASMPVTRVTDLVLNRTTAGEMFGFGDLRIESAGQDQSLANIPFLVEPWTFHRLAVRLATKPAEIDLKNFIDVHPVRRIGR